MSAAGSSAINGASRWLAARAGPTAASSCTTTAKATKREMRDRYPARSMTALLLGDVGYGLIRPYGPRGHAGLRGAPGGGLGGARARAPGLWRGAPGADRGSRESWETARGSGRRHATAAPL